MRRRDPDLVVPRNFRATPLKAGGLLYASNGLGLAEAFDPATGRTVWAQAVAADDLGGAGASRNLAYWAGAAARASSTCAAAPVCARRRAPARPIDRLRRARAASICWPASAPRPRRSGGARAGPLVVRDVVVIGGQGWTDYAARRQELPPGDVRGYDVRTGKLRWTFHVVPRPGESGIETWEQRVVEATPAAPRRGA